MEAKQSVPRAFLLPKREIASVIKGALGLQCNGLSPFADIDPGTSVSISPEAEAVARDPVFQAAAAIVAEPQLEILSLKGGSFSVSETFAVYGRAAAGGQDLASLHPSEDNLLVLYFESSAAYLDWWVSQFTAKVYEPIANLIAPTLPLEVLMCLLHAIDSYRRAYIYSLLRYSPGQELFISKTEFLDSMGAALRSMDARWLLPALFALTPGLGRSDLNLLPEHLDQIEKMGFIERTKSPDSGDEIFKFSFEAANIGIEFCCTWLSAMGWEATTLGESGRRSLSVNFLALTAISNHFFSFNKNQDGSFNCMHQPLVFDEMQKKMADWLQQTIKEAAVSQAAVKPAATATPVAPVPAAGKPVCPKCGAKTEAGAKFCTECGTPPKS